MKMSKRYVRAVGTACVVVVLTGLAARATFVPNLAAGKGTFATSEIWSHTNLADEAFGLHASSATWHFATPYNTVSSSTPYFGGVDLAGAGNTVSVNTVRIRGGQTLSPRTWTLQSRDDTADPLNGLVDAGWTDTGLGLTGSAGFTDLVYTFGSSIDTRALRFRMTEKNNDNDRLQEIEVFSANPHDFSRNAIDVLDPALSREDETPITTATNLELLRDDTFDEVSPGGVVTIQINDPPDARAVMNYDYTFPKAVNLEGVRFYFAIGSGNSHATSTIELQAWDGGAWIGLPGASQAAIDGLNVFDLTATAPLVDELRIKHTAYDIYGDPRSGLYAYEIEISGTPIPEPAAAAVLALAGILLARRRRFAHACTAVLIAALCLGVGNVASAVGIKEVILSESFDAAWDGQLVSGVNRPSATWDVGHGWGLGEAVTYLGQTAGRLQTDATAKASLISSGSYVKPTKIDVYGNFTTTNTGTDNAFRGGFIGFSSVGTGSEVRDNLYGIVLRGVDGQVGLINNNAMAESVAYSGTWDTGVYHDVSYWVDTQSGTVNDVLVDGVAYAFSAVSFFTDVNTNHATFYAASQNAGTFTWMNTLRYSEIPEPASMLLLGLGGCCCLARRRRVGRACGVLLVTSLGLSVGGIAHAGIMTTYIGGGDFQTPGSAAETARDDFLNRLNPGVTSNVFIVNARQDNYNVTTLTFGDYAAGTGAHSANVGSLMQAELNRGTGFIFQSGNGLDLIDSGLSGAWGQTMGAELGSPPNADPRYNNSCPGFIANRADYIGIAPIEGTTGSYTLLTDYRAFGVSLGRWAGPGDMTLTFFDATGDYLDQITVNTGAETRAYVGVIATEALGAVVLGSATYSPANDGFHVFDVGTIPEPASMLLLGLGGCCCLARRRH